MRLVNRSLRSTEGQERHLPVSLVGTREQLDPICAFRGMIAHQGDRLFWCLRVRNLNMILAEKIANIDWLNRPDGLSNG